MKKEKNILILIIIIILIIFLIIYFRKTSDKVEDKMYNKIMTLINNNESFILYMCDNTTNNKCEYSDKYINYLEDNYKIKFIHINTSDNNFTHLNALMKELEIKNDNLYLPIVAIREGTITKYYGIDSTHEREIMNNLIIFNYIDEKYAENDIQVDDTNQASYEFDNLYEQNEKTLLLIGDYSDDFYKLRKQLKILSDKYNFKYKIIYENKDKNTEIKDNGHAIDILKENLKEQYNNPSFIIIGSNKIIDYSTSLDNDSIISFLKKNNIIK